MLPPVLILALLLAAIPAGAAEVSSRVEFGTNVDSNQREVSDRFTKRSGYSASVSPSVEVTSERERLRYDLHYRPTLFYFSEADPHDRLNHRAGGGFFYDLGRRTTLGGSVRYSNTETLLRNRELDDLGDPELVFERERRQRVSGSLSLSRRWSPRVSASFSASQSVFLADRSTLADAFTTAFSASFNYRLSETITTGLSASARRQRFEDTSFREGATTRFFSLQGTWTQSFGERTTLSLSAGPLLVDPEERDPIEGPQQESVPFIPRQTDADGDTFLYDATTCPREEGVGFILVPRRCDLVEQAVNLTPAQRNARVVAVFPAGEVVERESERELTLSASASLTHRWRHTTGSLRFSRSEGSADGLGTSTVRNVFDASLEWRPMPDWTLRLWGNWTQRDSTSDLQRLVPVVQPDTVAGIENAAVVPTAGLGGPGLLRVGIDSNAADATFYSVRFAVWRRLGRRWRIGSILEYRDQKTESDFFGGRRDFENFGASLVLSYRFPDFKL